ncbi:MAG: hypothetical protein SVW77_03485 [Candidatus Nanohaloarchaea archaeon]|nr:hypothetical protein [Candidatus Nanohaloarchaea archaeon]
MDAYDDRIEAAGYVRGFLQGFHPDTTDLYTELGGQAHGTLPYEDITQELQTLYRRAEDNFEQFHRLYSPHHREGEHRLDRAIDCVEHFWYIVAATNHSNLGVDIEEWTQPLEAAP